MMVPVIPVSQALRLSAALVGAGMLIVVVSAALHRTTGPNQRPSQPSPGSAP